MDPLIAHFEARPRGRWRARWVWDERPEPVRFRSGSEGRERWVAFRRRFEIPEVPTRVPARAFADGRFVWWVNGREVARGPMRAPRGAARYVVADLAPFLVPGENVVAILVHHPGTALPWWVPELPAGELGRGALVVEIDLPDATVGTDRSWRCTASVGRTTGRDDGIRGLPIEELAPGALRDDWLEPGFDDGAWRGAVELAPVTPGEVTVLAPPSMPYGQLGPPPWSGPRPRRRRVSFEPGARAPVERTVLEGPQDWWVADLGTVTCGTVELEGTASDEVRFVLVGGELPDGGDLGTDLLARGRAAPGRFRLETFHPRGFRRLALGVAPPGRVRLDEAVVVERFSVPDREASFSCSDPELVAVWEAGRRTVDRCALDTYVDCPTREQRAWGLDVVVPTMVDLATSDRWDLPRWSLRLHSVPRSDGAFPMVVAADLEGAVHIPSVVPHLVRAFREVWRYTGDRDLLEDLLGAHRTAVAWLGGFQRADGLLWDVPGWNFLDWAAVATEGASSVLNGLFGRALLDLAELARAAGDHATVTWAEERHRRLRDGFERFWDPLRGRYLDDLGGHAGLQASQHGQAAALVGGLVPEGRRRPLAALMLDRNRLVEARWELPPGTEAPAPTDVAPPGSLWRPRPEPWWDLDHGLVAAQPFFRYVVHDAAVLAGVGGRIPELCRDWVPLLYRGDTTLSETWTTGTTCHAWSATPTRDLVVVTAGIRPAAPGFVSAVVAPDLGGLEWVAAAVPHPRGTLEVEIHRDRLEVSSPVPVEVDPSRLWGGSAVQLPPGRHLLRT